MDGKKVVRCGGGLSFVETDEVGLAPALFDGWGLRAYQPVLLEAAPSNRVGAQNLSRFVVAAVPSSGGLSPNELRVHNDLLHRLVDRFGSSTAHISTNLTHSGTFCHTHHNCSSFA
jgi:hypothetical protein